jgi:transposase
LGSDCVEDAACQSSWLVGGVVPGIERQPRKKLEPSPERLLGLLHRWRDEAGQGR